MFKWWHFVIELVHGTAERRKTVYLYPLSVVMVSGYEIYFHAILRFCTCRVPTELGSSVIASSFIRGYDSCPLCVSVNNLNPKRKVDRAYILRRIEPSRGYC